MASDNVVRRNYLRVTVAKAKDGLLGSLTRLSAKKSWTVLKTSARGNKCKVEIYKDEDSATNIINAWKVVDLEYVTKVQTSDSRKEFILVTSEENISFVCSSRADLDDWMRDLEGHRRGGIKGGGFEPHIPSPDEESFHVRLRQSNSLLFNGNCLLEIQKDFERNLFHIAIFTVSDEPPRLIVKWQIDHIRQYGSNDVAFKFQSGSKSPTGVDWFILDTDPGAATRIHRAVDYWAKHIVEQVRNIPTRSSSTSASFGPGNRPRKPSSDSTSPPPLPPSLSGGMYAPLMAQTRDERSIYEDPNKPPGNSLPPPLPPPPSSSEYQAINRGQVQTDNSTYADLQSATRERQSSVTMQTNPARTGSMDSQSQYMGLTPRTNPDPNNATYMGIRHK